MIEERESLSTVIRFCFLMNLSGLGSDVNYRILAGGILLFASSGGFLAGSFHSEQYSIFFDVATFFLATRL